jgi:hypothetical protein
VFADLIGEGKGQGDGAKISSIWTWLPQRARIEFIQNPDAEALLSAPGWLRYFPPSSPQSFLSNLFSVRANQAYLIHLDAGAETSLVIHGAPVVSRTDWAANSFHLTGFHIDPENPPTFGDYFAASPAHVEQPVYQLTNDAWQRVDVQTTTIEVDTAYWVFSQGASDYSGPLQLELPFLGELDYGEVLEKLTPRLKNRGNTALTVSLQVIGEGNGLYYANPDVSAADAWLALPKPLNLPLANQAEKRLPLGVRRSDFYLAEFNQILEITVPGMTRTLVPVTASAPKLHSLWVGSVTIEQVSQAQHYQHNCDENGANPNTGGYQLCLDAMGLPYGNTGDTMAPVMAEFSFRIILHREGEGEGEQVRLLKEVIQMWKAGEGDEPGHMALITDQTLIPQFSGVALRGGEVVGKRISTAAYDFAGDTLEMEGTLGGVLNVTLNLPGSAPTNPFRHEYHPDHNNLAVDYQTSNNEAYDITRVMTLTFSNSTTSVTSLGLGYSVMEGSYREVVTGLHKYPIISAGTFTLQHSSPTEMLNQ